MADAARPSAATAGCHGVARLVEIAVYAPIGLASVSRERVERRLQLARMIGRLVVAEGRRRVELRLAEQVPTAGTVPRRAAPSPAAPATEAGRADPTDAGEISEDGDDRGVPAPVALAIDDYESLAASQVVARLAMLTPAELDTVEAFEAANRNRRTVLGKIAQLRAPA